MVSEALVRAHVGRAIPIQKKRARRTGLWAQGTRCLDTPCEPLSLSFSLSACFPESYRGVAATFAFALSNQQSSICVAGKNTTDDSCRCAGAERKSLWKFGAALS